METLNGRYRIERPLGRGGMGEVYLASVLGREGFARHVAVKRIRASHGADPKFRAMFVREAQLSAKLAHSNIVAILDFDEDETGGLYLVMEYVDGVSLDALLAMGPLPVPEAMQLTADILRGLGYAHELPTPGPIRGLVHCDVTPHNVMLSWDGLAKVADFGIARARQTTYATPTANIHGKPAYMAPEHANGRPVDGRSDLFSVGALLWEMLCGAPLFARPSPMETLGALFFEPIPSPRTRRPDVPEDLEALTMRLLQRQAADRYPTAGAALAALAACRDWPQGSREGVAAMLVERVRRRAGDTVPAAGVHVAETEINLRMPRLLAARQQGAATATAPHLAGPRRRRAGRYVAVAGLLAGVAAGALWWTSSDAPSSAAQVAPSAMPAVSAAPESAPSALAPGSPSAAPATPPRPARRDELAVPPASTAPTEGEMAGTTSPRSKAPTAPAARPRAPVAARRARAERPGSATAEPEQHPILEVPLSPDRARWTAPVIDLGTHR